MIEPGYQPIAELLQRVRTRWQRVTLARAFVRAALFAAVAMVITLIVAAWLPASPGVVAAVGLTGAIAALALFVAPLLAVRHRPSDARLARFVEERAGALDERLVTAVNLVTSSPVERPLFAGAMMADAARAVSKIDATQIITGETLRRSGFQAAGALVALVAVLLIGRQTVRRTYDAAALTLFPAHIALDVTPGDARIEAGTNLQIDARLVGNDAPVVPQLLRSVPGSEEWQAAEMQPSEAGRFTIALNGLATSFQYRVIAGGAASKTFTVSVVRAPRVSRVDVEYVYPKAFGLAPRKEEGGGDIYAPVGTAVTLHVQADAVAASGQVVLGDNTIVTLAPERDGLVLTGALTVQSDNSYRIALADGQGLKSRGDTEYFIRTMDDRPPEVHVTRPASDRRVTALEEVEVGAEAADDFGVGSLDLVYAVRGGKETVVPLRIPAGRTSVEASHVLYLEDLDVRPGDFVSYYLRTRDVPRGRRAVEARSDIFFLEIRNFEEEFTLAQSQAAQGGGASNPQLDELVAAQKDVIVATWKLDRRAKASSAQSAQDVRSVATAETDLKTRVERVATSLRTSAMRDPRARVPGRGGQPGSAAPLPRGAPPAPRAGQKLSEEDAMTAAATAMGQAATALGTLNTAAAIAPEMEALNRLLEAQSDIRKREVQRQQQAGGGSGSNRNIQDLSSLFDKELARHQQTNYENQSSASKREEQQTDAADKIRDLAKRQDELLKRQQDLAGRRAQLSPEDVKRELEKLTREQNDLRQRAEEMAQELARQQRASNQESQAQPQRGQQQGQQSQQSPQGSQPGSQQGAQPGSQQQGQQSSAQAGSQQGQQTAGAQNPGTRQGQGQQGPAGQNERQLRQASEDMRASAGDLRREDPQQAMARGQHALDRLRELEQQMTAGSPDGQRRAMGDTQLEARQLADAERELADARRRAGQGSDPADTLRRLAGDQDRLADRLASVQQRLRQQQQASGQGGRGGQDPQTQSLRQAAAEASREIERQRLTTRMQESAQAMREQAEAQRSSSTTAGASGQDGRGPQNGNARSAQGMPQAQEEIARTLDRIAERLGDTDGKRDAESQRLSDQRARAQELRDRLNETSERLAALDREASSRPGQGQTPGRSGTPAQSSNGTPSASSNAEPASQDMARLRQEMTEQIAALRDLVGESRREGGPQSGATGITLEGQGMVLSAPGTEAFKQDFARWQELKRQATVALESIESSASQRLQAKESRDRLAVGADDRPPAEYQSQVDSYFKALAAKKKP